MATMLTLDQVLVILERKKIKLAVRLEVDAAPWALSAELREALADHKPLLLQRLVREQVWAELRTWRWGDADATPGIVVDRPPDPVKLLDTLQKVLTDNDPEWLEERRAVREESAEEHRVTDGDDGTPF
jgi:hypothetical protein